MIAIMKCCFKNLNHNLAPMTCLQSNSAEDNMRARLMKEASTGLDAEQKQTNVILYICIAVAGLVALGGGGILY